MLTHSVPCVGGALAGDTFVARVGPARLAGNLGPGVGEGGALVHAFSEGVLPLPTLQSKLG